MADDGKKIPWYSYVILVFHLTWSIGIILMTHSSVVSLWLRWAITGVFIVLALVFGIIDKVTKDDGTRDATPFDKWTIVHTLAGVVFGAWYVPIIYVLILVFFWECFEFSVTGFGETEVILNRAVDMVSRSPDGSRSCSWSWLSKAQRFRWRPPSLRRNTTPHIRTICSAMARVCSLPCPAPARWVFAGASHIRSPRAHILLDRRLPASFERHRSKAQRTTCITGAADAR